MPEFETLILRFRDLSTEEGETIAKHKAIIDDGDSNYVWWAWWKKTDEKVPENAFRRILQLKDEVDGPYIIYLFDTGRSCFYKAVLEDITWNNALAMINSPEPNKTPDYYNNIKYYAWFKFSDIESANDEEVLGSFSYVTVNEFFKFEKPIFTRFKDKKVVSCLELRHQERTIWFVRKSLRDDYANEILLLDSSEFYPSNFPVNVITTNGDTFLWLSDLHFSDEFYKFPLNDDDARLKSLAERLNEIVDNHYPDSLGGVIITGDLTWQGSEQEYQLVIDFIDNIKSRFTLGQDEIIVCPGNHDLKFSERPWEHGSPVTLAPDEARHNYEMFYSNVFGVTPNEYLCQGKRFVTRSGFCFEICAINSSLLEQHETVFQGQGYIGERQCDHIASSMKWDETKEDQFSPYKIAALHHHVVPILTETPTLGDLPSTVYDVSSFMDWLNKFKINLVLHGHMHYISGNRINRDCFSTDTKHDITVLANGSCGVIQEKVPDGHKNVASFITFKSSGIVVDYFEVQPDRRTGSTYKKFKFNY